MNYITRKILILAFLVCLSSLYVNNNLWASGCCGGGHSNTGTAEKAEVVKDPVCGMEVNDLKETLSAVHKGRDYYFCSEYCKKTFKNNPAVYAPVTAQQHDEGRGHKH